MANGQAGRGFGTDSNFVTENKIVTEVNKYRKWVGTNLPKALKEYIKLLEDKNTSANIKKGICEFLIKQGLEYYKEQGGKAKRSNKKDNKSKAPFHLKFTGTEE